MRARLALQSSGITVELREILLRDKPQEFLDTSATATVPALRHGDTVLDESLDIMVWALEQSDPEGLLDMPKAGWDIITANDGPFKSALDHTKYAVRYPELDAEAEREKAAAHLREIDTRLNGTHWLFNNRPTLADYAILPFIRQFANTDINWFKAQPWPSLSAYLDRFVGSNRFANIMSKYAPWTAGDEPLWFIGDHHER